MEEENKDPKEQVDASKDLDEILAKQEQYLKNLENLGIAEGKVNQSRQQALQNQSSIMDEISQKTEFLRKLQEDIAASNANPYSDPAIRQQMQDQLDLEKQNLESLENRSMKEKEIIDNIENLLKLNEQYGVDSQASYDEQKKSLQEIIGLTGDVESVFGKVSSAIGGLSGSLSNLASNMASAGGAMGSLGGAAGSASGALGNVASGMANASKAVGKSAGSMGELLNTLKQLRDVPFIGKYVKRIMDLIKLLKKLKKLFDALMKIPKVAAFVKAALAFLATGSGIVLAIVALLVVAFLALIWVLWGLADELDTTSKAIGNATGMANEFHDELGRAQAMTVAAGVEMKTLQEATISLAESFSAFSQSNEELNIELISTIGLLTKIGVASSESTKLMDHFTRAMGVSELTAADMTANLALLGKEMGVTSKKMVADFQAASGRLAIYGNNNIKVFKELEAQIKATGLEMSTLQKVAGEFDTFDSAAEKVANLNAVLGTQLSALEMLNATDAERINMIRQQVKATVGSFDSLDKFTKMHIAEAMGLNDVAEAQRLLNMSQAEYSRYVNATARDIEDPRKELSLFAKSLVSIGDAFSNFGRVVLYGFVDLIIAISKFIKAFSAEIVLIAMSIGGFFKLLMSPFSWIIDSFGTWFNFLGNLLTGIDFSISGIASSISGMVSSVTSLGSSFSNLLPNMQSVRNALNKVGEAVDYVRSMFVKKSSPAMFELPSVASGGFSKLAGSMVDVAKKSLPAIDGLTKAKKALPSLDTNKFDFMAIGKMNFTKVIDGIAKIKESLQGLATIQIDGFLAMSTDGSTSSIVMGTEGVLENISSGKLTVEVKMPEMQMPDLEVHVYLGTTEIMDILDQRIEKKTSSIKKALGGG